MADYPGRKSADAWRLEGNVCCKEGRYVQAIECYDQALRLTSKQDTAITLLLNRCHARIASQHFDAALADADSVCDLAPKNEKALFRAARALYGLRQYGKCHDRLLEMRTLYPASASAKKDLERCEMRLREQSGEYDFESMLDEAVRKSPTPDMDCASYLGPVEVRQCAIKSHGRGLFTTKAVEAGELLLVEKGFSAAFPDHDDTDTPYDASIGVRSKKSLQELQAELTASTYLKLRRNPSLIKAFASLYPGPDAKEEIDPKLGHGLADEEFVHRRIMYNAFAFPILSKDFQWRASHHPETLVTEAKDLNGCIGAWISASFINHSCYSNVRRSFIGDMMIFRAEADVPANTELKFGYVGGFEEYAERQGALQKYGFTCECSICESQRTTPASKLAKRSQILHAIIDSFEKDAASEIGEYFDLLMDLDETYVHLRTEEPRREFIVPCSNLITACSQSRMPHQVVRLSLILLRALGFEMDVTPTMFKVTRWGLLTDEVVSVFAELWTAYGTVEPAVISQVEQTARLAYLIMAGEDVSFEGAYGNCRPKIQEVNGDDAEMMGLVGSVKKKMEALHVGA